MQPNRLLGADFVRATATLGVLAHHLVQRINPEVLSGVFLDLHAFLLFGSFGVASFFVLSGYLLAYPFWRALDEGAPMPSLRVYTLRRAARIVPGFYLAITVSFLLSFLVLNSVFDIGLVTRFATGLLFASDWHWFTLFPVDSNAPLWSIGFEVSSYMLLPFALWLVFLARRFDVSGWAARGLWLVIILVVIWLHTLITANFQMSPEGTGWQFGLLGGARYWIPEFNSIGFFAIFAIGAGAAGVSRMLAGRKSWRFDLGGLLALLVVIGVLAAYAPTGATDGFGWLGIPYGFPIFPVAVALILVTFPGTRLLGTMLDNGVVRFVARISFGIYMWHYLILEMTRELFAPDLIYAGMNDVTIWAWLSAAVVALSLILATASFYWLEQPILRAARSWKPPSRRDSA